MSTRFLTSYLRIIIIYRYHYANFRHVNMTLVHIVQTIAANQLQKRHKIIGLTNFSIIVQVDCLKYYHYMSIDGMHVPERKYLLVYVL